ncbi:MAG: Bug family tripartite tricarboxylate transporter substrate binding protein [Xanthobacteraceae bacterium]
MTHRILLAALASAVVLAANCGAAQAQQYPGGPIRIMVGFGPGSTADTLARLVGKHLEVALGQPVVVENRPGNSSMIAAEQVARAPKDGHMLFMGTIAQTLVPIRTRAKFDLRKDMAPVALLGVVPNLLVAHPAVTASDVKSLVALARAKPRAFSFGTSGAGTASHLAAELFNLKAGTAVLAVHYQGGSNQALADLLAGRINLMFNVAATLAPHVEKGSLKPLGIAQPRRARRLPKVATMDEQGMPGFDAGIWIGLLAPVGTPAAVVEKISVAANAALKAPPSVKALDAAGIDPLGGTPAEFAAFIRDDVAKWTDVLGKAGLIK